MDNDYIYGCETQGTAEEGTLIVSLSQGIDNIY